MAEVFNCVYTNHKAIKLARDKFSMRNILYKNNLSSGPSILIDKDNLQQLHKVQLPVMIKDSAGTGSQNVWLARTKKQLIENINKLKSVHLRGNLMVEPYFSGTLYSIETITWQSKTRVLAISSRTLSPEPDFFEIGISALVIFSKEQNLHIEQWINKVLGVIDYTHGFSHTEFMVTENGLEIIEINPRLGGSKIGEALCEIYNYNIYNAYVEMAINKQPELINIPLIPIKGMAETVVYASELGFFKEVMGLDLLTGHPGIPVFYPTAMVGKEIINIRDNRSYVGVLVASGSSSEIALQNVLAAFSKISVVTQNKPLNVKPHLLLVGGWTAIFKKALEKNFDISYIGGCEAKPGFDSEVLKECKFVYPANIEQISICIVLAKKINDQYPLDAVISFSEIGLESAAAISATLRINGLELEATMLTRYKDQMRAALSVFPELTIPWKLLNNKSNLVDFFNKFGPSIIVKSPSGAGSTGVIQIKSKKELDCFVSQHSDIKTGGLMAEKLIDNNCMYSLETLSINGKHHVISVSQTDFVGYPYALISQIVMPPFGIKFGELEEMHNKVISFLEAIKLMNGVAHTEIKVVDGISYIIESQTRVGGDRIWEMTELTTGIDQIGYTLEGLVEPVTLPEVVPPQVTAGFFSLLPPPGKVVQAANVDFLAQCMAVREYAYEIKTGEIIEPITNNNERKGCVYLTADNHESLFSTLENITKKIWVKYEDGAVWKPSYKFT